MCCLRSAWYRAMMSSRLSRLTSLLMLNFIRSTSSIKLPSTEVRDLICLSTYGLFCCNMPVIVKYFSVTWPSLLG